MIGNYKKLSSEFLQFCDENIRQLKEKGKPIELTEDTTKEWSVNMPTEEKAWKDLMLAINEMGSIPNYETNFYKKYHKKWNILMDRARIYSRVANLKDKYGLDKEV